MVCILAAAGIASAVIVPRVVETRREEERSALFSQAIELKEAGDLEAARDVFLKLGYYKGSDALALECSNLLDYEAVLAIMAEGKYEQARDAFLELGMFLDAPQLALECTRRLDYNAAVLLMEYGDYEHAISSFKALGDFEDSAEMASECQRRILYEQATGFFNNGDYTEALAVLKELPADYKDTETMITDSENALSYYKAVDMYDEKQFYTAYVMFLLLGSFRDAQTRAEGCIQELPETGILFRKDGFTGTGVSFEVKTPGDDPRPTLLKLYSEEDELMLEIFLRAGESFKTTFPAGTYKLNMAFGDLWFGLDDLFGDDGTYQTLLFSDSETQRFLRGTYTLALRSAAEGNVAADSKPRTEF